MRPVRGFTLLAACALFGCQFRVAGGGSSSLAGADLAPTAADLAMASVPPDLLTVARDLTPPPDLAPPSVLVVAVTPTSGNIDLTQIGTIDWAHYGFTNATSFDDKASGGQRISTLTPLPNSGAQTQFTASAMQFTWSDGAMGTGRQTTASNSATDVFVTSGGQTLTVPAGPTRQRLIVYVGLASASGKLDVALSDKSQPPYSNTQTPTDTADHGFAYTIDFAANSPSQTLAVTWSVAVTATNGGAGVASAALTTAPPSQ